MSDPVPARLRRAAELALFVPFGLIAYARDVAPTLLTILVARGRGEVDRQVEGVVERVRHVKAVGDAAIAFGLPHRRRDEGGNAEANAATAEVDLAAAEAGAVSEVAAVAEAAEARTAVDVVEPARPGSAPYGTNGTNGDGQHHDDAARAAADALAIPGYDVLSASQVVERLRGLDPSQLAAIRAYETAHRNRQTILGKIDQLTA